MEIRDITRALDERDQGTIREVFRALVDFPHEAEIATTSAGLLQVSLNRVCDALSYDTGAMPRATCDALDLPAGASYAQGAQAARVQATRLARRFADGVDRRAGLTGAVAGRAL